MGIPSPGVVKKAPGTPVRPVRACTPPTVQVRLGATGYPGQEELENEIMVRDLCSCGSEGTIYYYLLSTAEYC